MIHLPVVLIMLFEVADAAAKMLGALQLKSPGEALVLLAPSVLTAKLPGEVFFTGTTTLLYIKKTNASKLQILITTG